MKRRLIISDEALSQLNSIFSHISAQSSPGIAERYVGGIVDYCENLVAFPHRGSRRDDLRPGIRLVGYRRQVTIAFVIEPSIVRILGVFYGGQDVEAAIAEGPPDG